MSGENNDWFAWFLTRIFGNVLLERDSRPKGRVDSVNGLTREDEFIFVKDAF